MLDFTSSSGSSSLLSPMILNNDNPRWRQFFLSFWTYVIYFFNRVAALIFPRTVVVNGRRLHLVRLLAEGGYGYVWLARAYGSTSTGSSSGIYALKQVLSQTQEQEDTVTKEIQAHRGVKALNVMPLLDYSRIRKANGREMTNMLFPLMQGSVQDLIMKAASRRVSSSSSPSSSSSSSLGPILAEITCLRIALGAARGISSLHASGKTHRDICPRNILLRDTDVPSPQAVVISDLGSAVAPVVIPIVSRGQLGEILENAMVQSSAPFRAPELWSCDIGDEISGKVDVWSLGCTMYACAFGMSPFESVLAPKTVVGTTTTVVAAAQVGSSSSSGEGEVLRVVETTHVKVLGKVQFPRRHTFSAGFINVMLHMLERNPTARLPVQDCIATLEQLLVGVGDSLSSSSSSTSTSSSFRDSSAGALSTSSSSAAGKVTIITR